MAKEAGLKILSWITANWQWILITPLAMTAATFTAARDKFHGNKSYTYSEIMFINLRGIIAGYMTYWSISAFYPMMNENLMLLFILYTAIRADKFFEFVFSDGLWRKFTNKITNDK